MHALIPRSTRRRQLVPAEPRPGVGTVLALIRTDEGSPDRPTVRFVLRIEVAGLDRYDAVSSAAVPMALLRLLRPGVRVAVRVDLDDRDAPEVDLTRLWITPAQAG